LNSHNPDPQYPGQQQNRTNCQQYRHRGYFTGEALGTFRDCATVALDTTPSG
jgi:hypothetical protein